MKATPLLALAALLLGACTGNPVAQGPTAAPAAGPVGAAAGASAPMATQAVAQVGVGPNGHAAAPLPGLNAPLPRRLMQAAGEGPRMWGYQFITTWQREEFVTRFEPSTPKYHYLSGEIIGWWPPVYYTYRVIKNGADWLAPGLDKVEHLSDNRFLLTVPNNKVWVVTQVIKPEGILLNGIPLGNSRSGPAENYTKPSAIETPTAVRILAGPGQQVLMAFVPGASMHGVLDDPAAYGNAFGAAKYSQ